MSDDEQIIAIPMGSSGGYGGGLAVPQMTQQSKADLMDKIKPELMVEIIRQHLLGKELINGAWIVVPALKDRRLTEVGAWEIANLMLGVSSVNISISKLNDKEIKNRAYAIAKTTQYLLIANWKDYGITNTGQFYFVHEIVFSNTLAVLKQADAASIQELIKGTVQETRNVMQQPQKEGGGDRLKRMLGLRS